MTNKELEMQISKRHSRTYITLCLVMMSLNIIPILMATILGLSYPIQSQITVIIARYLIATTVFQSLVVIPDIMCHYIHTFSSSIIQNSFELQKSLAGSVQASGGFGGFSFSASSSYKKTSSEISAGENVYGEMYVLFY